MSRTKGALNKKYKVKVASKKYRKRGRPRKIKVVKEKIILPIIKPVKFLGYCGKCLFMITAKELLSKFIYECPSCGKRNRISKLKKEIKTIERHATKKDYLQATIHVQYVATNHNEHDIKASDLKVQE